MIHTSIKATERSSTSSGKELKSALEVYETSVEGGGFFPSLLVIEGRGSHRPDGSGKGSPVYDEEVRISFQRSDLKQILNEAIRQHLLSISDFEIFQELGPHILAAQNHIASLTRIVEDPGQVSAANRMQEAIGT